MLTLGEVEAFHKAFVVSTIIPSIPLHDLSLTRFNEKEVRGFNNTKPYSV